MKIDIINDKIVDLETAILAKEKNFNLKTNKFWENTTVGKPILFNAINLINSDFTDHEFSAPEQSLLKRWLRVNHNIHVDILPTFTYNTFHYICIITTYKNSFFNQYNVIDETDINFNTGDPKLMMFTSYEDAMEFGLFKGLKSV